MISSWMRAFAVRVVIFGTLFFVTGLYISVLSLFQTAKPIEVTWMLFQRHCGSSLTISRNGMRPTLNTLSCRSVTKSGTWHFHGLISGIPSSEFVCPETITWRDPETNTLKRIRNTKGYLRWYRYSVKFGHFDCSIIKHYEACAAYVSKYITKQLADLAKSKHLYFCSQGLKKPDLVFDEDGVPFPFEQAEHEDEYCRISWATGEQLIGTMLPEWYDEWASDVRDPEQLPAGMTRGPAGAVHI